MTTKETVGVTLYEGDTPPNATTGLWIDTSAGGHVFKRWNGSAWAAVDTDVAATTTYDHTSSGLSATNVQAALDELAASVASDETRLTALETP